MGGSRKSRMQLEAPEMGQKNGECSGWFLDPHRQVRGEPRQGHRQILDRELTRGARPVPGRAGLLACGFDQDPSAGREERRSRGVARAMPHRVHGGGGCWYVAISLQEPSTIRPAFSFSLATSFRVLSQPASQPAAELRPGRFLVEHHSIAIYAAIAVFVSSHKYLAILDDGCLHLLVIFSFKLSKSKSSTPLTM